MNEKSSHVCYFEVLFKFTSAGKSDRAGSTVWRRRELEYLSVFGVAQKGRNLCPWVRERVSDSLRGGVDFGRAVIGGG